MSTLSLGDSAQHLVNVVDVVAQLPHHGAALGPGHALHGTACGRARRQLPGLARIAMVS